MNINKLAEVIRTKREKKGYSQRELAKEINISNSELSRIEKGERQKPDIDTLSKLAHILELSLQDLLELGGYNEILISLGFNNKRTKSVIDYERDLKEYQRFYYDILEDSSKKKDIVRKQRGKLDRVLEQYELSQMTDTLTKAPTYDELIKVMREVNIGLEPSAEKFDYSKLPKI